MTLRNGEPLKNRTPGTLWCTVISFTIFHQACRKELRAHQGEFDILYATTQQCLSRSNDTVSDAVEKEFHDVEQRWLRVFECTASNQRTLELTLGDWQEYTTVMEDTMRWLRQTELYLKTSSAASLSDVEQYSEKLKVRTSRFR